MLAELEPLPLTLPSCSIVHIGARSYRDSVSFEDVGERGSTKPEGGSEGRGPSDRSAGRNLPPIHVGSTSTPKGVQLQHFALIENMWQIGERMHVTERDRLWLAVSLFWGLGCENALFNLLTHGGCVVLQEHFRAEERTPDQLGALHAVLRDAKHGAGAFRSPRPPQI